MSWKDDLYAWAMTTLDDLGLTYSDKTWGEVQAELEQAEASLLALHAELEERIASGRPVPDVVRVLHDTSAMNVFASTAGVVRMLNEAGIPENELPYPSMMPLLSPNPGALSGLRGGGFSGAFGAVPFRSGMRLDYPQDRAAGFGWIAAAAGGVMAVVGVALIGYGIHNAMAPNTAAASVAASGASVERAVEAAQILRDRPEATIEQVTALIEATHIPVPIAPTPPGPDFDPLGTKSLMNGLFQLSMLGGAGFLLYQLIANRTK